MKITELKEAKREKIAEARYRITLTTRIGGDLLAYQTRVTATSPQEGADIALKVFKSKRGDMQDAVLRSWQLREVTPIVQGRKK